MPTLLPPASDLLHAEGAGNGPADFFVSGGGSATDRVIGHDPDGDGDGLEEDGRKVTVNISSEGDVDIGLESNTSDGGDEVKVQFGTVAAQLKVSFETLAPQREEVEMRIEFRDLVEFEDRDGDGAFSPLDDEVIQWMRVENLGVLRPPEVAPFSADSVTGQQVNITYGFPEHPSGSFDLIFQVFGLPTQVDGLLLGPTETKIDIRFTDFPFVSDTSQLALGLDIRTNFELEVDPSLTFDQVNATGEEFAAFFRWMPEAVLVDGNAEKAEVTIVRVSKAVEIQGGEFESELRLFLAYPRGSEIVHDPIVGILAVASIPPLPVPVPSLATYAIGLGTALLLVVGLWALHRRRS
jgi:hypothetical protein